MEQLLLVNPRKRRARKTGRSAAQKRATARMLAANRAARRSNPSPRASAQKRRRRSAMPSVKTLYRRRRRNPASPVSGIMPLLNAALMGAAGATAVNAAVAYLPLPDTLKTGNMSHVVKAVMAMGLGVFGRRFIGKAALSMAQGALTVTLTDAIKGVAAQAGMSLGYYAPAITMAPAGPMLATSMGSAYVNSAYDSAGLGEYVS